MIVRISAFILSFLLVALGAAYSQLTYDNLLVDYDSALVFKNLKVIPVRWKGPAGLATSIPTNIISLGEAMEKGMARISERGTSSIENVHWLVLENLSDKNIYVSSGEILAGGRQDRVISRDTIMNASQKRMQIPVMCAEEGRWSEKEKKWQHHHFANIHLRKVVDRSRNQVQIWREIYNQLERDKVKNTTLAYLSRTQDKKYSAVEQEYYMQIEKWAKNQDSTIVGIICVSGNVILGSDIFTGTDLFYSALPSLAYGYINEAIVFGAPPKLWDVRVMEYTDHYLKDEKQQEEWLKENGKLFRSQGVTYHITSY